MSTKTSDNWVLIAMFDQDGLDTKDRLEKLGFKVVESTEEGLYKVDLPTDWTFHSRGVCFVFCNTNGTEKIKSYRDRPAYIKFC